MEPAARTAEAPGSPPHRVAARRWLDSLRPAAEGSYGLAATRKQSLKSRTFRALPRNDSEVSYELATSQLCF